MNTLPLAQLEPSPFNPRKTYDAGKLQELADSIRQHGVLQPILVRPFMRKSFTHQIVAGHRRAKAAALAGLTEIPVVIRGITDVEAKFIQLAENDAREDVKPSEQSVSYKALADEVGLEETARRTGRPLSAVRELVRLSALPAWFMAHVDSGLVSRAVAAIVARVPGVENRDEMAFRVIVNEDIYQYENDEFPKDLGAAAAKEVNHDRYLGPMNVRDTKDLVREKFSRELKSAPFSRKALDLVPAAGSCDACPKRAGNDPDLVAEGVRADICTDTGCYQAKVEAHGNLLLAAAKTKGELVMTPKDVEANFRYGRLNYDSKYLDLSEQCYEDPKQRTYGQILKDSIKAGVTTVTVAIDPNGQAHRLADKAEVKKVLARDCGIKASTSSGGNESWKKHQAAERKQAELGKIALSLALEQVVKTAEDAYRNIDKRPTALTMLLHSLAKVVPSCLWHDSSRVVARRRGLEGNDFTPLLRKHVSDISDPAVLFGFIAEFIATKVAGGYGASLENKHLNDEQKQFDQEWGIDRKKLLAAAKEAKEKKPAKPSLSKAAKSIPEGPMVCKPLGSIKLVDIDGITEEDSILLANEDLITLFDLEKACKEYIDKPTKRGLDPGIRARTYDVLRDRLQGKIEHSAVMRIGDCIIDHLNVGTKTPEPTPTAKPRKGKSK